MRPVERGASPKQSYPSYGDAAEDLEARLGRYCSYCERRLETHLAVEHIRPKSSSPALAVAASPIVVMKTKAAIFACLIIAIPHWFAGWFCGEFWRQNHLESDHIPRRHLFKF